MTRATKEDIPHILRAIENLRLISPAAQMKYVNMEAVEQHLTYSVMQGKCYFSGGVFVLFDTGGPWYSNQSFLIEDLIIRVYPGPKSDTDEAIASLIVMAEKWGCVGVISGDTQIGYMTPKYIAAGYTVLGTQLIKELPNGIHPKAHRR